MDISTLNKKDMRKQTEYKSFPYLLLVFLVLDAKGNSIRPVKERFRVSLHSLSPWLTLVVRLVVVDFLFFFRILKSAMETAEVIPVFASVFQSAVSQFLWKWYQFFVRVHFNFFRLKERRNTCASGDEYDH